MLRPRQMGQKEWISNRIELPDAVKAKPGVSATSHNLFNKSSTLRLASLETLETSLV